MTSTRPVYYSIVLFILWIVFAGCSVKAVSEDTNVGDIQGMVVDREGQAIENARVAIGSLNMITGPEGTFAFSGISQGIQTITVSIDDEFVLTKDVQVGREPVWMTLLVGEDELSNLIDNYDFSLGLGSDGIPIGWVKHSGPEVDRRIELSEEKARVGKYSLKLVDESASGALAVRSASYPVEFAEKYRVEVDVFVVSGRFSIYLDYLKGSSRVLHSSVSAEAGGEWQRIGVDLSVPEEADNVSIILFSGAQNVGEAYFDNVLLYKMDE